MSDRRASGRSSSRTRERPKAEPNLPVMFGGLSERMESKGGGGSFSLKFEYGKAQPVQFLGEPNDPAAFYEFEQHQFNAGGWKYVPCLGKGCPLCDDEDSEVSKTHYRFIASVYSFSDKEVRVMEGPKTLAQRIAFRWANCQKKNQNFRRKTYEVTKMKTTPVSYDVEASDDPAISTRSLTLPDLEEYIKDAANRFFGDTDQRGAGQDKPRGASRRGSSLDADDEDDDVEDEDEPHTRSELSEMSSRELKDLARSLRINPSKFTSRSEIIRAIMKKER